MYKFDRVLVQSGLDGKGTKGLHKRHREFALSRGALSKSCQNGPVQGSAGVVETRKETHEAAEHKPGERIRADALAFIISDILYGTFSNKRVPETMELTMYQPFVSSAKNVLSHSAS